MNTVYTSIIYNDDTMRCTFFLTTHQNLSFSGHATSGRFLVLVCKLWVATCNSTIVPIIRIRRADPKLVANSSRFLGHFDHPPWLDSLGEVSSSEIRRDAVRPLRVRRLPYPYCAFVLRHAGIFIGILNDLNSPSIVALSHRTLFSEEKEC